MELLSLPSPARKLWRTTRGVLHRALSQLGRPQPCWHVGGGTILAQRWAHRESTDIDLMVPAGSRILELDKRFGGTLEADMYALGARDVLMGATLHRIVFDEGVVDIAELDSRPASGHRRVLIDGHEVAVKSTAQILRGKLERAVKRESPARDLFDVAVAHHADPHALAGAVNMLDAETIRGVGNHWETNAYRLEQEAGTKLLRIAPEYEPERRRLVARAVERLDGAVYRQVTIRKDAGGVAVLTRTGAHVRNTLPVSRDDAAETLDAAGIGTFLDHAARGGAEAVLADVLAALDADPSSSLVIFDWNAGAPVIR